MKRIFLILLTGILSVLLLSGVALAEKSKTKTVPVKSDLNQIIQNYVATVVKSNTLTDIEKESLLSAFSVMGYSYVYWSENLAS